ncbi:uncharacterized protein Dvar_60500 [Desulfosarcina variabilis str. Montpellier]
MMAEFKKSIEKIIRTLLLVFLGMSLSSLVWAEATIIKRIRTGSEKEYVRVVIETNARIEPRPKISVKGKTLQISLAGAEKNLSDLKSEAYRNDVVDIDVTRSSTVTQITVTHINAILAFNPIRVRTFFLANPHRFVVDAYRPSSTDAGISSADPKRPVPIIEESGIGPNEANKTSISQQEKESSMSMNSVDRPATPGDKKGSFQQRLLLFLIVVTSIILVVIIFLMCMDTGQKET